MCLRRRDRRRARHLEFRVLDGHIRLHALNRYLRHIVRITRRSALHHRRDTKSIHRLSPEKQVIERAEDGGIEFGEAVEQGRRQEQDVEAPL